MMTTSLSKRSLIMTNNGLARGNNTSDFFNLFETKHSKNIFNSCSLLQTMSHLCSVTSYNSCHVQEVFYKLIFAEYRYNLNFKY